MLPGIRGQATITLMTEDRPLTSWNRKTSLLRDRSNSARGQRRRQKTSLAFRRTSVHSDCRWQRLHAKTPGVCEPSSTLRQGRTRSDLLFTMSNNTRLPGEPKASVDLCHFWTSETGCPQRAGALFFRKRSLSGYCGSKVLCWSQAETDAGLKVVETAGNHARQTPSQSSRVADLVEPDGIEPTTSCLQSRRSPN